MRGSQRYFWIVSAGVLLLVVALIGCSDEQKSDAAKMEQQLLEKGESAVDTSVAGGTIATPEEMPVEAVPEEPEAISGPAGGGYALQVASCESRDYAEFLADKYISRGYTSYMTTFNKDGQRYYRVRLGPFESLVEARQLKVEIADKYSVSGWIAFE